MGQSDLLVLHLDSQNDLFKDHINIHIVLDIALVDIMLLAVREAFNKNSDGVLGDGPRLKWTNV